MSRRDKVKLGLVIAPDAAPEMLTRLAEGFASGRLALADQVVELADFRSVELKLKVVAEGLACKLKVKYPKLAEDPLGDDEEDEPAEPAGPGGRPRYSRLKKRMGKDWKRIREDLRAGQLPDPALLATFVADNRLMCEYPGKGDPMYPEYLAAVDVLEAAMSRADLAAVTAACIQLNRLKKGCHAVYK